MRTWPLWMALVLASPLALGSEAGCGEAFTAGSGPPDAGTAGTTATGAGAGQGGGAGSGVGTAGGGGTSPTDAGTDASAGGGNVDGGPCVNCPVWYTNCFDSEGTCNRDKLCPGTSAYLANELWNCVCEHCVDNGCTSCPEGAPDPGCRACLEGAATGTCSADSTACLNE